MKRLARHALGASLVVLASALGCAPQRPPRAEAEQKAAGAEARARALEAQKRCEASVAALRLAHHRLHQARDELRGEVAERRQTIAALTEEGDRAFEREEASAARIERLEGVLRERLDLRQLSLENLTAGRIFELLPGEKLQGPLAKDLLPAAGSPKERRLSADALLEVGGAFVDELRVTLERHAIVAIELSARGSGEAEVAGIRQLVAGLCAEGDERMRWSGRPGPGTPKSDPISGRSAPLTLLKASCGREAGPWSLSVEGRWQKGGAPAHEIEVTILFEPSSP